MPEKQTIERAKTAKRQGKAPTTQAGEFVREEIHHIRRGKHGARSAKQAIAIGLSKARRSGVEVPAPKPGTQPEPVRKKAVRDLEKGRAKYGQARYPKRSQARLRVLKREGRSAASPEQIARQVRSAARARGPAARRAAARKAVQTKGKSGLRQAARKAAKTRERRSAVPA